MVVFSWVAKYLNQPSDRLYYLNRSVYPLYLAHQTFVLVVLYYRKDLELGWRIKFLMIPIITFAGCFALFEIVKQTRLTRILFGIKPPKHPERQETSVTAPLELSGSSIG